MFFNTKRCNPEVYENGIQVARINSISAKTIEAILKDIRILVPTAFIDWHSFAGSSIVKVVGNERDVWLIRETFRSMIYVTEE